MKYPELETLKLERVGPVGWLINNRPEQLNAMNAQMRDEFEVAWKALDADPDVRVIVHTGEGRAFQTGVDVTELATDGQGMERYRESVENWDLHFTAWHNDVWKPVITAVNGICAGGAFHWIADADIVIASSDATFFDPHVSVGQVVAIEAIGLMKRMPVEAVMRMAFARPLRAHARATGVRARHDQRGRRPARAAARPRRRSSPRRSRRTHRRRWPRPSAPCGARWSSDSPTRAGTAPRSSWGCGATPIRRKARARSRRSGRPEWQPLTRDRR